MSTRRIVFFGNCQALAVEQFCKRFLAPRSDDVTEAINIAACDPLSARKSLDNADVIVHQVFDKPHEIDVIAEYRSHDVVNFPNVYALFYWPYTNQRHPRNDEVGKGYDVGPYPNEMGDSFLNRLILNNTPAEEALDLYLQQDVAARAERLFEMNAGLQRQRDEISGFDIQGEIEQHFRDEALFLTSAHPKMRIFSLLARGVFSRLGYETTRIEGALATQRTAPFPRLALPIHPNVIKHFGLTFANDETRYPFFEEGDFTFAEYVRRYMNFEWNRDLHDALPLAAGDPDIALPRLEAALRASPRSATGARVRGELLIRKHDFTAAKAAAALSTELDPDDPRTWLTLARAHRQAGELNEAAAVLDRAISVAPRDAEIRIEAACLAADHGLWQAAAEEARLAAELEPGAARFYSSLSDFLGRAGRLDEAIDAARRAVELDTENIPAYRLILADRLDQGGRGDEALSMMREVIARGSRDPHDHARLGHMLARRDDLAGAETAYRQAVEMLPGHTGFRLALAEVLDRKGEGEAALAMVRAVVADGSRDPHAHARLGHLLSRAGDFAEAETAFREAVALAPGQPGFRLALADVLNSKGESAEAATIAQALAAEGSRDAHLYARLGHFLVRIGDGKAAEAALRRAIDIAPEIGHYPIELADIIDRDGRTPEAIVILQALAAEGSRHPNLHLRLGQLLASTGDLDAAEAAFRTGVEIAPDEPRVKRALAELLAYRARNAGTPVENLPESADDQGEKQPVKSRASAMATDPTKRSDSPNDEITGRSRSIRLGEGLNVLSFGKSEGRRQVISGFALPATQVMTAPGGADGVTIVEGNAWLGADGGTVIVRAAAGGGTVFATTYGAADDAALPPVKIVNLAQLPDIEAPLPAPPRPVLSQPAPPQAVLPAGREIAGELVLHIERQGDRRFQSGEWAGNPGARLRIEGFAIRPLETIAPGHIEYMAFGPGGRQTPWVTDVKLCGTRGRGFPLTGFAVRLTPALRGQFDVVYEGQFFESGVMGPLRNGEPCLPAIADDPLGAIRLRVIERLGA